MEAVADNLLRLAASQIRGTQRRRFLAEVCEKLCHGNTRRAEERFGWGRDTIDKGFAERSAGPIDEKIKSSKNAGRKRFEDANPQLAIDIRLIAEPHTQTDPELKTERQYSNLSAAEVRQELLKRGYQDDQLPSERTLRDILNRMNYRLKRIQKGKPLKKTADTDAIFENVQAVHAAAAEDPECLEISIDTKTKVKLGEYSQGGKTRTDGAGRVPQALDHDPPAKEKLVPFGVLMLATGLLTLVFGSHETSDFWVDSLKVWWTSVRDRFPHIRLLVIYLDNGPKNSGVGRQFLKRMIEFADWSGLTIHLVYYPPYHSKYNPIERCWSSLQRKWNGVLLTCISIVLCCARRMRWKGRSAEVHVLEGDYTPGIKVSNREMKEINARLERSATLSKYDIIIRPITPRGR
jgi:transposase